MDNGDSFGGPEKLSFLREVGNEARRRGPFYAGAAAFALLIAIGTVMWASYPRKGAVDPNAVPVIHADATPYRSKPDDPGGMNIPYRDSTVFDSMHGEAAPAEKVENLLPQAEQPLPREKLIPGYKPEEAKTETPPAAPTEAKVEPAASPTSPSEAAPATAPVSEPETKTAEPPIVATTPPVENIPLTETVSGAKISNENLASPPAKTEAAPAPAPSSEPAPASAPEPAPAPAAAAPEPAPVPAHESKPAPAAAKGDYFVQLGSVENESAAAPTWKKLQSSLSALDGLTLTVVRADLPKGVFYRLQSGPFDKAKAKDICAIVTAQKPGGCLVVKH